MTPTPRSPSPFRTPWVRLALVLVFLASLPFPWSEETYVGCSGQPTKVVVNRGSDLFAHDLSLIAAVAFVLLTPLGVALLVRRARPGLRVLGDAAATVSFALAFCLALFVATFTFGRSRLLAAAMVGLAALAVGALHGLAETTYGVSKLLRARRSPRDLAPKHSPGSPERDG